MEKALVFNKNRTFKIAQFTDLHFFDTYKDKKGLRDMELLLDVEKPDLVVMTGDIVYGSIYEKTERGAAYLKSEYRKVYEPLQKAGVPWAMVLGNHDPDGPCSGEEIIELDMSLEGSLTKRGPETVYGGVTNYYLGVFAENSSAVQEPSFLLWMFDITRKNCEGHKGDDCVATEIVQWYRNTSAAINSGRAKPIDSFMFFHIPVPEMVDLWNYETCYGLKNERVCCPQYNTGLFNASVEMGDVRGMFVGHDHVNDFCGTFRAHPDLRLCYGRKTGYGTYNPVRHGARFIQLTLNDDGSVSWNTWIRNELGEVEEQPEHQPTGPGQTKCGTFL